MPAFSQFKVKKKLFFLALIGWNLIICSSLARFYLFIVVIIMLTK